MVEAGIEGRIKGVCELEGPFMMTWPLKVVDRMKSAIPGKDLVMPRKGKMNARVTAL
jgi:hypothetical protein